MKRGLTLAGGIIGTLVNAALSILLFIVFVPVIFLGHVADSTGIGVITASFSLFIVIGLALLTFLITALILNAVSIGAWNGSAEKYGQRRGVIITAIVFNLLIAGFYLLSLFGGAATITQGLVMGIVVTFTLTITSVFYIVDLCLERKHTLEKEAAEPKSNPAQQVNEMKAEATNLTSVAEELTQLNNLKQSGAISEQEYDELKTKLLEKYK